MPSDQSIADLFRPEAAVTGKPSKTVVQREDLWIYDAQDSLGYTLHDRGPRAGHARKREYVLNLAQHVFKQRSTQAASTKP